MAATPSLRWLASGDARRRAILFVVGVFGLLITAWVTRSLHDIERERLQLRFQSAAQARAGEVVDQMRQPLEHLATLQRLFGSVDRVDWPAFRTFAEPMLSLPGVRSFNWLPRVSGAERAAFESALRDRGGARATITEYGPGNRLVVAGERAFYFPVLYAVPEESTQGSMGFDVYSVADRAALIDHAIADDRPNAGAPSPLPYAPEVKDAVRLVAPVYRRDRAPVEVGERIADARGVVILVFSVGQVFAAANGSLSDVGFNVRLLDRSKAPSEPALATWESIRGRFDASASDTSLRYARPLDLANHAWAVEVVATPAWVELNAARGLYLVPLFGVLLTALLLVYLRILLNRSALADWLELNHQDGLKQRQAAEAWANKLSLAVEQNPSAIYITDLEGRIEYVNAKFVETTGYARAEAIGRNARVLRTDDSDESVYRALWATIEAGHDWQGELPGKRRDGSIYWSRVRVSPLKDDAGRITNYVMSREDITELRAVMLRLRESEGRFRGAMSAMAEGLAILSSDGRFLFANRVAEQSLGFPEGGLLGRQAEDVGVEMLREDGSPYAREDMPAFVTLRQGCEVRDALMGLRAGDGCVRWLQVNTSPLPGGDGAPHGAVVTFSDITDRRHSEEQLRLASEAMRQSGEGILITDAQQRILSVNPAFEMVTGYSADEVCGKTPALIASHRHDARFFAAIGDSLENTGHWRGAVWNRRKNGDVYPEWMGVSVVRGSDGAPQYFIYIYSDMSERQAAQQRIEFLAHHDPLTSLPNRLLLRDRMEQAQALAMRMHSRVALLFLDLDRFKTINDSLGHPTGDALLKQVVERLKSCVRESDTISRQGGDEFVILLNDVRDSDAVSRVADKIHQRMGEPFVLGAHSLITSFSIGIALYPDDGDEFDALLQKADTAMYHAKEAGRNGHRFFTEQMNRQVVEHLTLETQLRQALENREFVLHYQPQLDLQEGRIIGVEALLRWNSPEHGLVSPARFIPVAEASGMIVPIGAWVLGEACRQARAWQDAGLPPFVVAVNLSAVQFKRTDLVNTVINALVLSDLDSQWLELELTESILIQDAEATLDAVRRLKALGVRLSVDDFGTGYSSLTYLKRFAVDKLKIDQSFIRDLVSDPDDAAIVRAIIQMARSLKLRTIAEGVESEELANLLHIFHCDEIQGYWFARPMPADDLEAFVRAHQLSS